ncbi:MAB_1171c family putative transporter [Catenulispora pinisilvae]|uniref:MAB_1171c family putative transporter n=1 Tax=Catenulispora pinisilvae TaxID=2705253 RepID=UPI00189250B3|nr:MAB_1171c family putative transporter [Catenulispora pinisilvae]
MSDLAAYLGAAVLVALAAYAFAIERRGVRRPIRWAALAFALSEGCSLALLAPGTVALSHAGVDGLSVIALGDTVRTAALSFLMLLACLLTPHPAPRHSPVRQATVAIAVQLGMVLLFVAAQPTLDADDKLIAAPSGRWWLAVRVALFASYAVWALVELFLALLPSARTVPTGPLRWGVRLILAAVCVGVVWTLWSYDDFVRVLQVGTLDGSEDTVSNLLGALCASLAVAGALVGKWTETFGAAARWVRLCRCYFAMGPLWSALHQAMPEIAFPAGGRPLLVGRPAGIEFAVYRRVIEIHDGRLVLRAYQEAAVSDWLSSESGSGAGAGAGAADAALAEAATIAIALENMRLGRRSAAGDGIPGEAELGSVGLIPTDLDSEVQWLSQVARAFRRSPVIPVLLERLRQEADRDGRQLNRPA